LQERRISLNIGLEEVSEATGISSGVLKTLENDDREQFPAEVYVKAFYKKYVEFLGLDPEVILSAYQQQSHKKSKARRGKRKPCSPEFPANYLSPLLLSLAPFFFIGYTVTTWLLTILLIFLNNFFSGCLLFPKTFCMLLIGIRPIQSISIILFCNANKENESCHSQGQ
jgi:cytoskeletal protein RodZ